MLIRNFRIGQGIMARVVWPCYGGLSPVQHGVGEISRSVEVCAEGRQITMGTTEATAQARAEHSASMANLRGEGRLHPDYLDALPFGLVLGNMFQHNKLCGFRLFNESACGTRRYSPPQFIVRCLGFIERNIVGCVTGSLTFQPCRLKVIVASDGVVV